MAPYIKAADFANEAKRQFKFLSDQGFTGPAEGAYELTYSSDTLTVVVIYSQREGRISTGVTSGTERPRPRAWLPCLIVAADIGPAQRVREIARTLKSLEPVLVSQASALHELLPRLTGPGGAALLHECHGR